MVVHHRMVRISEMKFYIEYGTYPHGATMFWQAVPVVSTSFGALPQR